MEKRYLNSKGVTLVALVITIILILIIAGVAISISFNHVDINENADKAKKHTNQQTLAESVRIAYSMSLYDESEESFKDRLEAEMTEEATISESEDKQDVLFVKKDGETVTLYEDGDMLIGNTEFAKNETTGNVTAIKIECPQLKNENGVWNWYIYKPGQLKFLACFVNNGYTLEGETDLTGCLEGTDYSAEDIVMTKEATIYIMNNLDFGARPGEGATEAEKWAQNISWTPIGTSYDNVIDNLGTIEGNNYTIKGIYVNLEGDFAGIFGVSNEIRNLTVKNSYISGTLAVGGISGYSLNKITNCHNINTTVTGNNYISGITGFANTNVELSHCDNSGNINGNNYVSGIVGCANTNVTIGYCSNSGAINGNDRVSGVVGYAGNNDEVVNCSNKGTIVGNSRVSGIAGSTAATLKKLEANSNSGAISGKNYVGGIVGHASGASIVKCSNTGTITGNGTNGEGIGGIAGHAGKIITMCWNTGDVTSTGTNSTDGIVGRCVSNMGQDISLCYNSGKITGATEVGGIGGVLGSTGGDPTAVEYNCYNKGIITCTSDSETKGAISGRMGYNSNIMNCYYLNGIGVDKGVGQIGSGGDIDLQNSRIHATDDDLSSYDEFIVWIEQHIQQPTETPSNT